MLKTIFFTIISGLTIIGCKDSSLSESSQSANMESANAQTNSQVVIKLKEERELKDVVWKRGEFNLRFPCEISENESEYEKIVAATNEEIEKCGSGNHTFIASSKKSRNSLKEELEKFVKEKKASISKPGELMFGETFENTITQTGTKPNLKTENIEARKTRLYKINNNWLIRLEVVCSSPIKSDCEDTTAIGTNNKIDEFFNSIKINK